MSIRSITNKQKEEIYYIYNCQCNICGKFLLGYWRLCDKYSKWGREGKSVFVIDNGIIHHHKLLSEGGENTQDNRELLCVDCHIEFHRKHTIEYYRQWKLQNAQRR